MDFSADRAFQAAILATLNGDATVVALVEGRVFDGAPADAIYPMVTFGPCYGVDADSDCVSAQEVTQQIDIWGDDQGRIGPCRDVAEAVRRALHCKDLAIADPFAVTAVRVIRKEVRLEPDAIRAHGIVQVRAHLEG